MPLHTPSPLRDVQSSVIALPTRPPGAAVESAALPTLDLRAMLLVLRRRRWLITGVILTALLGTVGALTQVTPHYTAEAQVMVDPRQTNVVDMEQVLSGLPANAETIQSEMQVLRSRNLAERVIEDMKLARVPEFAVLLDPTTTPEVQTTLLVSAFLDRLTVRVVGRSRVITIGFTAQDAALAAAAANRVANLYLTEQLETKFEATRRASAWLSERLGQLRSEAEVAEQAVDRARADMAAQDPATLSEAARSEAASRLRSLEREAAASRALFETFLTRSKQTTEQEGLAAQQGLAQADARLISSAAIPAKPSFPDLRLFMLLALMGGAGLGVILAFLAEQLDNGFRSSAQIEQFLGLPSIGQVPSLRSLGIRKMAPDAYVIAKPTSSFAESIRALRTSLLLADLAQPPRVVAVSSALPGEGKTTVVLSLARLAALSGEKVIVVDADMRRPRVHSALSLENGCGLTELLCGRQSLEQVVRTSSEGASSFDVITAGAITPHATELVRSQQMKALLRRLAGQYALVLVDGPPVLPVADSRVLASIADKVLYVVRWQHTPRETAQFAIKQLREVGANLAGVVMNQVDVRKQADYGYGDSGYYYGRYRNYYND